MVPEKSLGTGISKIWYQKKVSEPVSENFGTVKSTSIGIVNIWYPKKVSVSVSLKILGTVKLCFEVNNSYFLRSKNYVFLFSEKIIFMPA